MFLLFSTEQFKKFTQQSPENYKIIQNYVTPFPSTTYNSLPHKARDPSRNIENMQIRDLEKWRNEVLSRLEDLQNRAKQIQQQMTAQNLVKLEDKSDFVSAWQRVQDLFPDDLQPNRTFDLNRHIGFAEKHDFSDIELLDIPAVMESVQRYGRNGADFINEELDRLQFTSSVSDIIHPRIKDACAGLINHRRYTDAARTAVGLLMDELRRQSGEISDGDALIRHVIKPTPGKLGFSDCKSHNSKKITEGFREILLGLYKGVRNPTSHGEHPFGRGEVLQVMTTCSLLLTQLQFIKPENGE